jgi:exodeoxyribonuclease-5
MSKHPTFKLSPDQQAAKAAFWQWMKNPVDPFVLMGLAGSGKTTLAIRLAQSTGLLLMFAAHTGRARHNLRIKGGTPAKTTYSLLRFLPAGYVLREGSPGFAVLELLEDWKKGLPITSPILTLKSDHHRGEKVSWAFWQSDAKKWWGSWRYTDAEARLYYTTVGSTPNPPNLEFVSVDDDDRLPNLERDRDDKEWLIWGALPDFMVEKEDTKRPLYSQKSKAEQGDKKKKSDEEPPELIVIDECSMVEPSIMKRLLALKIPLMLVGDPFQLPAMGVGKNGETVNVPSPFDTMTPDARLTVVHRQGPGSAILRASHAVCMREPINAKKLLQFDPQGQEIQLLPWERHFTIELVQRLLGYDQVICQHNDVRQLLNAQLRSAKGFSGPIPQPGEQLMCWTNYRTSVKEQKFVAQRMHNGSMWRCINAKRWAWNEEYIFILIEPLEKFGIKDEDRPFHVLTHQDILGCETPKSVPIYKRRGRGANADEFPVVELTWAYAVTAHKSQGGEWGKVAVFVENYGQLLKVTLAPDADEQARRWLYTAMTRAAHQLLIVTGNYRDARSPEGITSDGALVKHPRGCVILRG